ncbi:MAG: TusE/DsrC/DsvC family sulfur relay protein [Thermoanaerobaculia bacterium]
MQRSGTVPQMPRRTLPGLEVEVDESGFLLDELDWTPEIAETIARDCGVGVLSPRHWRVVLCCREAVAREGLAPDLPTVARFADLPLAELDRLFRHRPAELLPKIAGLPRPPRFMESP